MYALVHSFVFTHSYEDKIIVVVHIHEMGKVWKHGDSWRVKVAQHGVALPTAEGADESAVDSCSGQGHGSGGAGGFHVDTLLWLR